ncbi:MAG: NHL repeat-containing protein [Planctomycetes bacterium]|nr:NHL repeat-containing protein [Planctomycetota bacterium]
MLSLLLASAACAAGDVQLGGFVSEYADLAGPAAAVFAQGGAVCISEAFADQVTVFDAERHRVRAIGKRGTAPGELLAPTGLALADDGELYVADTGNDRISVFRLDGAFVRVIGVRGSGPSEFHSPNGVAVDAQRLYVADTRNHRVQIFDRAGRYERDVGGFGCARGEYRFPHDLAVDAEGRLYVADTDNHRIQKLDPVGRPLAEWGVFGPFPGQLASPTGVKVVGGRVHVADRDNHRVEAFDLGGKHAGGFGLHALLPHEGAGKLHYPSAIALAPDGARILVVEAFEHRAQLFGPSSANDVAAQQSQERNTASHFGGAIDAAGVLFATVEPSAPGFVLHDTTLAEPAEITRSGGFGTRIAQFVRPEAIELDPKAEHAYVADAGAARLVDYRVDRPAGAPLKYDPALARFAQALDLARLAKEDARLGGFVEPVALECATDGALFVLDAFGMRVLELTPRFELVRVFPIEDPKERAARSLRSARAPVDLAVNADGSELYVLDALAARVFVFDRAGKCLRAFGEHGDGESAFVRPAGIACASDGSLWISDAARNRVVHVDARGAFLGAAGREGLARGEFWAPRGVAFDPQGRRVVLDHGNHRGQVFDASGACVAAFGARLYVAPPRKAAVPTTGKD